MESKINEIEFSLFERKENSFFINEINNIITYSLLAISTLLWFFASSFYKETAFEKISIALNIVSYLIGIVFIIKIWFTRRPLNGKFDGTVKFTEDSIIIKDSIYLIENIRKIDFRLGDYYDNIITMSEGDLKPAKSNGVDNLVDLYLRDGQNIKANFQIIRKDDSLKMRDLLIHYFCHNKLTFLRLTQLLHITEYDKIQEFKKTLPPTAVLRYAG